jgi:hypothetical protein
LSFELHFQDSITALLTSAARPGRCVEHHLVEALCRFFVTFPMYVVWGGDARQGGVGMVRRADGCVARISPSEVAELRRSLPPVAPDRVHEDLIVRVFEDAGAIWGIELADPEMLGQDRLLVVLEGGSISAAERRVFFKSYLQGQRELYAVVKALHSSARLAEWTGAVHRLTSNAEAPLGARLAEAERMVDEMSRQPTPEMLALVRQLSIWAVQEQLGTGWRVSRLDGCHGQLRALCSRLREVAEQSRAHAADAEGATAGMLHCLADMLAAETEWPALHDGSAFEVRRGGEDAIEQLRTWTLIHELARELWRQDPTEDAAALAIWLRVTGRARPELARLLAASFERAGGDAALLRNWLRLWFCHTLKWHLGEEELSEKGLTSVGPWRWRADLAYVIRECLRFECFGDRPDYRVQPDALAESLRTVVEFHAIGVAHVSPRFPINWLLQEISGVTRADDYHFTSGHLQHVLEAYIFGHFVCAVRVDDAGAAGACHGWTIAALLASKGNVSDEAQERELLQAFSVAALLHDVGMLLFPRYIPLRRSLYEARDEDLERHLDRAEGVFRRAGADMSTRSVEDLQTAKCLDGKDPELARWMDEQKAAGSGKPDHALLGAWYLHRLCRRLGLDTSDVVRQALRAIMLHQVMSHQIDVERDPAAALLTLCDELFEWDPYMRSVPVHNGVSRSLHTMAVDIEPNPSRARRIQIEGLRVEATEGEGVVAWLRRAPEGQGGGWPRIHVELKHPEFLGGKVHHYWLTMAQNLGRLVPYRGFGPMVLVKSQVPPWLERIGGFRDLLRKAVDPSTPGAGKLTSAPSLRQWLSDKPRFEKSGGYEIVRLGPIPRLFTEDAREYLAKLEELVNEVVLRYPAITIPPVD